MMLISRRWLAAPTRNWSSRLIALAVLVGALGAAWAVVALALWVGAREAIPLYPVALALGLALVVRGLGRAVRDGEGPWERLSHLVSGLAGVGAIVFGIGWKVESLDLIALGQWLLIGALVLGVLVTLVARGARRML